MNNKDYSNLPNRVNIIETVQTPLGFFTLTVLVVEAILGLTANFSQGSDRSYLIVSMIALIFILVVIVAGFAFFRPEALRGKRPTANRSSSVSANLRSSTDKKLIQATWITDLILTHKLAKPSKFLSPPQADGVLRNFAPSGTGFAKAWNPRSKLRSIL